MLDKPPPSRFQVKEQDGRLIVIDSQTGMPPLTAAERQAGQMAPANYVPLPETGSPENIGVPSPQPTVPRTGSAPSMQRPSLMGQASPNSGRLGRIAALIVIVLLVIIFLIWTNLWFIFLMPLLVPQARTVAWTAAKKGAKRFIDGNS
jgi:hypothetical protein